MGSKDAEEMGKFSLQPNLTTKTKSLAAAAVNKTGLQSPQLQPNVAVLEFHLLPLSSRHGQEPQTRESGLDKTSIPDQSCTCMKLSHYAAIHAQSLWSCPLFWKSKIYRSQKWDTQSYTGPVLYLQLTLEMWTCLQRTFEGSPESNTIKWFRNEFKNQHRQM